MYKTKKTAYFSGWMTLRQSFCAKLIEKAAFFQRIRVSVCVYVCCVCICVCLLCVYTDKDIKIYPAVGRAPDKCLKIGSQQLIIQLID